MTYRGQVKNGVVVLAAGSPGLTEGTLVDVTPVPATQAGAPRPGTASAVLRHAG